MQLDTMKGRFFGILVMNNQTTLYVTPAGYSDEAPKSDNDLFNLLYSARSETIRSAYCCGAVQYQIIDTQKNL